MDIEKLIERLKEPDCDECTYEEKRECAGSAKCVLSGYAAEALSTLQAENENLRAELNICKEKNAGLALALLTEFAPNPDCLGDDEWTSFALFSVNGANGKIPFVTGKRLSGEALRRTDYGTALQNDGICV